MTDQEQTLEKIKLLFYQTVCRLRTIETQSRMEKYGKSESDVEKIQHDVKEGNEIIHWATEQIIQAVREHDGKECVTQFKSQMNGGNNGKSE